MLWAQSSPGWAAMLTLLLLYMKIIFTPKQPLGPMQAVSVPDPFVMGETK